MFMNANQPIELPARVRASSGATLDDGWILGRLTPILVGGRLIIMQGTRYYWFFYFTRSGAARRPSGSGGSVR